MTEEKLKAFVKEANDKDDEDSLFGIFYKSVDGKNELRVNGGDWMGDEIADFIEDWCKENNVDVEFEAEVPNSFFTKQGFKKID